MHPFVVCIKSLDPAWKVAENWQVGKKDASEIYYLLCILFIPERNPQNLLILHDNSANNNDSSSLTSSNWNTNAKSGIINELDPGTGIVEIQVRNSPTSFRYRLVSCYSVS